MYNLDKNFIYYLWGYIIHFTNITYNLNNSNIKYIIKMNKPIPVIGGGYKIWKIEYEKQTKAKICKCKLKMKEEKEIFFAFRF